MFEAHATPTREDSAPDPYRDWPATPCAEGPDGSLVADLGIVDPDLCLGHFVGYPALPLAIMQRHVTNLVAEGVRRATGRTDARVTLRGGEADTRHFAFAGQHARLVASRLDPRDGLEVWETEVFVNEKPAAVFRMEMDVADGGDGSERSGGEGPRASGET